MIRKQARDKNKKEGALIKPHKNLQIAIAIQKWYLVWFGTSLLYVFFLWRWGFSFSVLVALVAQVCFILCLVFFC